MSPVIFAIVVLAGVLAVASARRAAARGRARRRLNDPSVRARVIGDALQRSQRRTVDRSRSQLPTGRRATWLHR